MTERFPVTLGNGCAVTDRLLVVAGFPDSLVQDQKYTRMFYLNLDFDEPWQHTDWADHTVTGLCLRKPRDGERRAACALSDEGYVQIANSDEERIERIPGSGLRDVEPGHDPLGPVRGINEIGSSLFVCGYYGQLYRRASDGWIGLGNDLRRQGADTIVQLVQPSGERNVTPIDRLRRTANLNAVDGYNEDDVYTCGLSGHLYHFTKGALTKVETQTDAHLLDLHSVSENETVVCGYNQTLLLGNHRDGFRLLHESSSDIEFWSVRKFQGHIHVGTTQGLWRFNGATFDVVRQREIGFGETTVIQQIDSISDEYLWVVGDRHVFRYDGRIVERYDHPDNR